MYAHVSHQVRISEQQLYILFNKIEYATGITSWKEGVTLTIYKISCYDVADYFIRLANETGSYISNLKLQKLVYYAQAWYLAIYGTPLFEEDFEAWVHGPVIPDLYQEYRPFKWKPILKDVEKSLLSQDVQNFLAEVSEVYFSCDAYELERMTHQEEPWVEARRGLAMDVPSNAVISKESIEGYYKARAEEED